MRHLRLERIDESDPRAEDVCAPLPPSPLPAADHHAIPSPQPSGPLALPTSLSSGSASWDGDAEQDDGEAGAVDEAPWGTDHFLGAGAPTASGRRVSFRGMLKEVRGKARGVARTGKKLLGGKGFARPEIRSYHELQSWRQTGSGTKALEGALGAANGRDSSPRGDMTLRAAASRLATHDLLVQVMCAKGVRSADVNGLSDPYCTLRVGKAKACTRVVPCTLNPTWNETFVFRAEQVAAALQANCPFVMLEIWDYDGPLAAPDFLGQAIVDLLDESVRVGLQAPLAIPLHAIQKGVKQDSGLGSITAAVWLRERNATFALGGKAAKDLSSMVVPPSVVKAIPAMAHAGGNTLYEEPCMAYALIMVHEVRHLAIRQGVGGASASAAALNDLNRRSMAPSRLPTLFDWKSISVVGEGLGVVTSAVEKAGGAVVNGVGEAGRTLNSVGSKLTAGAALGSPSRSGSGSGSGSGSSKRAFRALSRKPTHGKGQSSPAPFTLGGDGDDLGGLWGDADDKSGDEDELTEGGRQQDGGTEEDELNGEAEGKGMMGLLDPGDGTGSDMMDVGSQGVAAGTSLLYYRLRMTAKFSLKGKLTAYNKGQAKWTQPQVFPVVLPMSANHRLKLSLMHTKDRRRVGKQVATCYLQPADVLGQVAGSGAREPGKREGLPKGVWYKVYNEASVECGEVRLAVGLVDMDPRRRLYKMPVLVDMPTGLLDGGNATAATDTKAVDDEQLVAMAEDANHHVADASPFRPSAAAGPSADTAGPATPPPLTPPALSRFSRLVTRQSKKEGDARPALGGSTSPVASGSASPALTLSREDSGADSFAGRVAALDSPKAKGWAAIKAKRSAVAASPMHASRLQRYVALLRALQAQDAQAARKDDAQALGEFRLLLGAVDLLGGGMDKNLYCMIKCGPHWGRTRTVHGGSGRAEWNWEVHLPVYEPSAIFTLVLFAEPFVARKNAANTQLVGKLRVRLSTIKAGVNFTVALPMLGDRAKEVKFSATAHMQMQVLYNDNKRLLKRYLKPLVNEQLYYMGVADDVAGQDKVVRSLLLDWLEQWAHPAVPRQVSLQVLGLERYCLFMSRLRVNAFRIKDVFAALAAARRGLSYVQSWQNVPASMACVALTTSACYRPGLLVPAALLAAVLSAMLGRTRRCGEPVAMVEDPVAAPDDEAPDGSGTNPYTVLMNKYRNLVRFVVRVQVLLDDVASALERVAGMFTWTDPIATTLALVGLMIAAGAILLLGLPFCASFAFFYILRPPMLRTPTPPPPVNLYKRLPSKADVIA